MTNYYSTRLSADRLRRCYELATPAVRRYLDAEIDHVRARTRRTDRVLELGCGYGRVMREIAPAAGMVVGIDTAIESLDAARDELTGLDNVDLCAMDVARLGFRRQSFDLVFCVQNGISAFRIDPGELMRSAVDAVRRGGVALFSSYAARFWSDRLEWFRLQASEGLIGEIDEVATVPGTIVCRDGFVATTFSPEELTNLARALGLQATAEIVAESSVFLEIRA